MNPPPTAPDENRGEVSPEMVVRVRAVELRRCTTTRQLDRIAAQHGFTDPRTVERFLTALLDIAGIDYEGMRQAEAFDSTTHRSLGQLADRGPRMLLYSAATTDQFTLCAGNGRIIWRDHHPPGTGPDIAAAEAAARQAIWLAGLARTHWGADAARLRLVLADADGVNRLLLHAAALTAALVLELTVQPVDHPATDAGLGGPVFWSTADLAALIDPTGEPR
ncbi:hypothetical protein IU453_26925 [Nocardia cyriacigeorgica]|uniref:hypothetical protein n=1 Tax=Nocardia cyriacigeorgica TaxID=135487 RepID=UPI0018962949|nr:hypothetical protein [Nocardia cyriacigeorgica]MBF6320389.1 hypothetical protein [Nocardia cyriacigeorgica]MBF6534125.1 hypothetical protein [Nocardia cyriacigeorgica]